VVRAWSAQSGGRDSGSPRSNMSTSVARRAALRHELPYKPLPYERAYR
jgi:hypothetical protein